MLTSTIVPNLYIKRRGAILRASVLVVLSQKEPSWFSFLNDEGQMAKVRTSCPETTILSEIKYPIPKYEMCFMSVMKSRI